MNQGLADLNIFLNDSHWGLTAEEQADFFPSFFNQSVHPVFDNQRLGFPPNRSMEVMYYNQTWLEELGFAGPPTTPDEFREMACAAAEANGDGTGGYILRDDASAVASWTYAFGGDILSEDGTGYVFNSQATLDAMTFLKGLYDDGCAYFFTEGFPNPEFAARRAIFAQGSSSGMPFYAGDIATVAEENGTRARCLGRNRHSAHHGRPGHECLWWRRHDHRQRAGARAGCLGVHQVVHLAGEFRPAGLRSAVTSRPAPPRRRSWVISSPNRPSARSSSRP